MPRRPANYIPTNFGNFELDALLPVVPQLYSAVHDKILTMQLKPGDPISEAGLAAGARVSRTPARQVIKQLVHENLLVAYPSRGTYVSKIDTRRLKEALVIRRQLEPYLARQCAIDLERGSLVTKLRGLLEEQKATLSQKTTGQGNLLDAAFHKAIGTNGGEGMIWQVIRQARAELDRLYTLSKNRTNLLQGALDHHKKIIDAIEAGDGDQSFAAMDRHMRMNEETLTQILTEQPDLFSEAEK